MLLRPEKLAFTRVVFALYYTGLDITNTIVGVPHYDYSISNIPQNPILIIKAPILAFAWLSASLYIAFQLRAFVQLEAPWGNAGAPAGGRIFTHVHLRGLCERF